MTTGDFFWGRDCNCRRGKWAQEPFGRNCWGGWLYRNALNGSAARALPGTLITFSSGTLLRDPANIAAILPFGAFAFYTAQVGEARPPTGVKKFL